MRQTFQTYLKGDKDPIEPITTKAHKNPGVSTYLYSCRSLIKKKVTLQHLYLSINYSFETSWPHKSTQISLTFQSKPHSYPISSNQMSSVLSSFDLKRYNFIVID